ncbi:hypothetical protein TNCV_2320461 [Trichonephila clavipes]|nr:hypothetical protein TNCV_2320461 [Trichonephila clavipes]
MWTSSLFEYEFILPGEMGHFQQIGVRETPPFSAKTVWISLPEYDRGRRRQGRLFPEGWEKKKNHSLKSDLIKRSPRQNGEGGRTPKLETLYRSRAPAGGGKKAGRNAGWPKAVTQRR